MVDSGVGIAGLSKSIAEYTSSSLDYWSPLIVEKGVRKSYRTEIRPHSISSNDGPVEFHISPDPTKFIDIKSLTLHGKVGIRKKHNGEWNPIAHGEGHANSLANFTIVNNFFQSLFSSVNVKVNDCEIGDVGSNTNAYHSYLQTLLSTPASGAGRHILDQKGFTSDYNFRGQPFLNRPLVDFNMSLHNDLMTVEKYIPPNTKISLTLRRTDDDFVIIKDELNDNDYKIVMEDLHIKVTLLELYPDVLENHFKELKAAGALQIKYTQNSLKTFACPENAIEMKSHNLFFGDKLPNRVYVAFVEQSAFNGDSKLDPFNFEVANMREACLIVNGVSEPSVPYNLETASDEKELYFSFLENTGSSPYEMECVDVSFDDYYNGKFVLAWDRSPTKDNGLYTHKQEGGSMSVRIRCRKPLAKNYMVLVFASYDSKLVFVDDKVISQSII